MAGWPIACASDLAGRGSGGGHRRPVSAPYAAATIIALRQDWIRTARAKGVSHARLVWHHVLPHALLPVVTVLALDLGSLFSGVLVSETVFAYPAWAS